MNRKQRRQSSNQKKPAAPAFPPAVHSLFTEALRYHQAGHLSEAEQRYRSILAITPNHTDSLHFLGVIAYQAGQYDVAIQRISQAIQGNPLNAVYHGNLGLVFKDCGQADKAIASFNQAIMLQPTEVNAHYNLGTTYMEQKHYDQAVRLFNTVIAMKPDHAGAYNALGVICLNQKKYEEAIGQFKKSLAVQPANAGIYSNLGNAFRYLEQYTDAATYYKRAFELNPHFMEVSQNLGLTCMALGHYDEAVTHFKRAVESNPAAAELQGHLGKAFQAQRKWDEAITHFKHALAIDQNNIELLINLADALIEQNNRPEAELAYRRCLELDPGDTFGVGLILASLGGGTLPKKASELQMQWLYTTRAKDWDSATNTRNSYQGHALVAEALEQVCKGAGKFDILDIGCGTGLVGQLVRNRAQRLVGIDCSAPMLEQAKAKGIYDELHQGDLVAFMTQQTEAYDVITCAATLIHFGDLTPVMAAASSALRRNGVFIGTLFPNDNAPDYQGFSAAPFALAKGGCYIHSRDYIQTLAKENGFTVETFETKVHEYYKNEAVMALVVTLRRHMAN